MAVLTETAIRRLIGQNKENVSEFYIEKGQIITPAAKSYLSDRNIAIRYAKEPEVKEANIQEPAIKKMETVIEKKTYKYKTVFGASLDEKPEHMTQLKGNLLVFKDHKRIIFRGRVDSLESEILKAQIICNKMEQKNLVEDLQDILNYVRNLIRCEVLDVPFGEIKLIGLTESELREQSHYPQKYFGIGHEFPSYEMGEQVVAINGIRSLTREVEIAAYEAFKTQYGEVEREDIIQALNRLSSAFWIIIYKIRTNKYK